MVTSKLELRLFQLATKFQRLYQYLCFWGPAIQWEKWQCFTTKREETGSGKSRMVVYNLEILESQHVHKMATKFQRLYSCLEDWAPRLHYCEDYPTCRLNGNQWWRSLTGNRHDIMSGSLCSSPVVLPDFDNMSWNHVAIMYKSSDIRYVISTSG